jgi:predicted glycosyltransferase
MISEAELARLDNLGSRCGVPVQPVIPDLSRLFATADAVVCMGGYNTLTEALVQGVPAVCAPRTAPREEQAMRAAIFEHLGLIRVLAPEALTPEKLAAAVEAALRTSRPRLQTRAHAALDFNGATKAARRLMALASASRNPRPEKAIAAAG